MCLRATFPVIIAIAIFMTSGLSWSIPLSDGRNPHNLSANATHSGVRSLASPDGGTDQICIFCHTPHNATPQDQKWLQSTLWNRPDPTQETFPLYGLPLAIKTDPTRTRYNSSLVDYPSGASRLCLSCHDGVTAIGTLRDGTQIAMETSKLDLDGSFQDSLASVINLTTSHPVSFVYNQDVLSNVILPYYSPAVTYQLPPDDQVDTPLDGNQKMQCTTCHDPHEDTSVGATYNAAGLPPFWRNKSLHDSSKFADAYEEVCGQCHLGISLSAGAVDPGPFPLTTPPNSDHNTGPVLGTRP